MIYAYCRNNFYCENWLCQITDYSKYLCLCSLHQVVLERVLGLTVTSNAGLDCDPVSGNIAYLAGCVFNAINYYIPTIGGGPNNII